jgi:hypothetical protein
MYSCTKFSTGYSCILKYSSTRSRARRGLKSTCESGMNPRTDWIRSGLLYCVLGREEITSTETVSFRWILPFWYLWLLLAHKASLVLWAKRKQKYQNGNIRRKLTAVPTSEREGKLSNPRGRAARAMHGENLRKFTETHARPPRALCTGFLAAKYTVPMGSAN